MDQAERLRNIIKVNDQQRTTARVITVTSGKGGVGKSSISVNLALALIKLGKKVVVFDADFGLANVEVMLGIRPKYNLADLIYDGKDLKDIITEGPEKLGFISGGSGIQGMANLNKDHILTLTRKLYELDSFADIIIIDTGAGISDGVIEFIMSSREVILVATPEPTSITDAYALLKTLDKNKGFSNENTVVKLLVNRVSSNTEGREVYNKLKVVVDKFLKIELDYLGSVPQDVNVSKAIMQQKPVSLLYPSSISSKAFVSIANMLCNESSYEVMQKKEGINNFFGKLFNIKKNKV